MKRRKMLETSSLAIGGLYTCSLAFADDNRKSNCCFTPELESDSYRTMGASWSRCSEYSSNNPGELVQLNIGNIQRLKLMDCSSVQRVIWSDDTGFRCLIKRN